MGDAEPEARQMCHRCSGTSRGSRGLRATVCEVAPRVTRTVHAVEYVTGDELSQSDSPPLGRWSY